MRNILIKCVLLLWLGAGAGALQASPIESDLLLQYQGWQTGWKVGQIAGDDVLNGGADVYAGMYRMSPFETLDSGSLLNQFLDDEQNFNAFCVETSQALYTGTDPAGKGITYSLLTLENYLGSPDDDVAAAGGSSDVLSRIAALFSLTDVALGEDAIHLGAIAEDDAAFQLALWTIINDEDFKVVSGFGGAPAKADGWLSKIDNPEDHAPSRFDFYVLRSDGSQNLLVWKAATEVPLPATLWLMLAGILGVGLARRS